MFVTTMRTVRILGWGREPRTTEFAPPPRGAFLLGSTGWAASSLRPGCLIRTNFSPILIYVCRMCPGPCLKRAFARPSKQLLTESRLSFQSEALEESHHFLRG